MSASWARAVLAVAVVILMRTRVPIAPGWVVPLPVLVLAAMLAVAAGLAAAAVMLACGLRSSPAWRPSRGTGGAQ